MEYLRKLPVRSIANRLVPLIVGFVLVGAAILKAHRLLTDGSDFPGGLASHLVLIEAELLVGLTLFFAIQLNLVRIAALALFAIFLVAALWQGFAGAQSCACLGKLEVHPWIMAGLDVCVLGVLWFWKPDCASDSTRAYRWCLFLGCCGFPALLPILILTEREQVRAESRLVASRSQEDLGDVPQGKIREFELFMKNAHDREITVNAVETSCPCLKAQGLPWRFSAGEGRSVRFRLDLAERSEFTGSLLLEAKGKAGARAEAFRVHIKVQVVAGE